MVAQHARVHQGVGALEEKSQEEGEEGEEQGTTNWILDEAEDLDQDPLTLTLTSLTTC